MTSQKSSVTVHLEDGIVVEVSSFHLGYPLSGGSKILRILEPKAGKMTQVIINWDGCKGLAEALSK